MWLTLVPAYGRDYKSAKAVQEDWDAGKDFLIQDVSSGHNGRYCNKNDNVEKGTTLKIRYKALTQIKLIKIK